MKRALLALALMFAGPAMADTTIVPDPTLSPGGRQVHRRERDLLDANQLAETLGPSAR